MQALCAKPSLTPEGRTLGAGWAATRQNADEQHAARLTFCQVLRDLANDLATFRKEIDRQKEQHLKTVATLNSDLEKGKSAVNRTKTLYHTKTQAAENALIAYEKAQQDPTVAPKNLSKLSSTATKSKKDAEVADSGYQQQLQEFQAFQVKYEESMKEILKEFQLIEERRVVKLKEVIDAYIAAQTTLLSELNKQQDSFKSASTKINGNEDVQNFINENKTGLQPPKPTEYEPYKGKHEQFKKKAIPKSFASQTSQSDLSSPKTTTTPVGNRKSTPDIANNIVKRAVSATAESAHPKAKALFDYAAADATELGFSVGDIITVTKQDSSGWWEGELKGKHGMFPGNYVELIAGAAVADTRKTCVVKFEFTASGDDELSIQVGEIIYIDSEAPGWYSGTNSRGQSGLFPANYVELQ